MNEDFRNNHLGTDIDQLRKCQKEFDRQYLKVQGELAEHKSITKAGVKAMMECIRLQLEMSRVSEGSVSRGHIERANRFKSDLEDMVRESPEIMKKLEELKQSKSVVGEGGKIESKHINSNRQDTNQQISNTGGEEAADSGWMLSSTPKTSFDDIIGMADLKSKLINDLHPAPGLMKKYKEAGYIPRNYYMLYGPPGTGKTMIAEAIAHFVSVAEPEFYPDGMKFYNINCTHLLNKFVGDSEKKVAQLFTKLKQVKNAIVFMDEFDSICPDRKDIDPSQAYLTRIVNLFLSYTSGIDKLPPGIWLIMATNHPEKIDSGMTSRCANKYYIPLPDTAARAGMLRKQLVYPEGSPFAGELFKLETPLTLEGIASLLDLFSGRDILHLCDEIKRLLAERSDKAGIEGLLPLSEEILFKALEGHGATADLALIRRIEEWGKKPISV